MIINDNKRNNKQKNDMIKKIIRVGYDSYRIKTLSL